MKHGIDNSKKGLAYLGLAVLIFLPIFIVTSQWLPADQIQLGTQVVYPYSVNVEIDNKENHIYKTREEKVAFDFDKFTKKEAFSNSVSGQKLVYVVAVQNAAHRIYEVAYNVDLGETFELDVPSDTKQIYMLFPEFSTVKAVTKSNSQEAKEFAVIDGRENVEDGHEGGGLKFRTFKIETFDENKLTLKFDILSEFEVKEIDEESDVYGRYEVVLKKHQ